MLNYAQECLYSAVPLEIAAKTRNLAANDGFRSRIIISFEGAEREFVAGTDVA